MDLQRWADIFTIIGGAGVLAGVAALWLAWVQLRRTEQATRAQMLLAMDQALAPFDDIRIEARNPAWTPPPNEDGARSAHRQRIKQYMGVYERIEHLLAAGLIDAATVDRMYGPRIEFLFRNPTVRAYVIENPRDWQLFLELGDRISQYRRHMTPWIIEIENGIDRKP